MAIHSAASWHGVWLGDLILHRLHSVLWGYRLRFMGQSLMKWFALQRKHVIGLLLDDGLLAPLPRPATPRPLCGKLLLYGGTFNDMAATVSLEVGYMHGCFSSISALSTTVLILPGDELVWTSPYQTGCNVLLLSLAISSSEQLTFMLSITFLDNCSMMEFVSCSAKIVFSATLRRTVALVIVMKANILRVSAGARGGQPS